MDILKYINSKDIREHLRRTNYDFTPVEAAWLIYLCTSITLAEKHKAWQMIIDTMSDYKLSRNLPVTGIKTLHEFLQKYISLQNRYIEQFPQNENTIYNYVFCASDGSNLSESSPYSDYDHCRKAIHHNLRAPHSPPTSYKINFKKTWLDIPPQNDFKCINLIINSNLDILDVSADGLEESETELLDAFSNMWFAIPTPFKRGDIVHRYTEDHIYVLDAVSTWNHDEYIKNGFKNSDELINYTETVLNADAHLQMFKDVGDINDLYTSARIFFVHYLDGTLIEYEGLCYLDLEFYDFDDSNRFFLDEEERQEFNIEKQTLQLLSNFFYGEISFEQFFEKYARIVEDCICSHHAFFNVIDWKSFRTKNRI